MRTDRIIALLLGCGIVVQTVFPAAAQSVPAIALRTDVTMQDLENAAARGANAQSYTTPPTAGGGTSGNVFQAVQQGDYNTITAVQTGTNNVIQIMQAGQQNQAAVTQAGSYNRVTLRQGR